MAAGLGFKNFSTGDVLSATDVNGYLMQGILVFASAAARDAAITAPAEGQFAYLKDTNVTTYYTGSAWANVDSTGMTNPMTTTGDTIYSSSGSTPARLGIGTTGQILTVSGGVPSWATPAGGGSMTLLSTTSLSGSTTTVSSIDQTYEYLYIQIADIVFSTGAYIMFKPNGNNPNELTFLSGAGSTGGKSDGNLMGNSTSGGASYITINLYNYKNTSEEKNFDYYTTFGASVQGAGFVKSDSAITSISLVTSTGTFTGGTMRIYGVK